tara:strand:- start:866 stop:1522 length:657 start_codon:yes stop_codon:yes gene_type:complete
MGFFDSLFGKKKDLSSIMAEKPVTEAPTKKPKCPDELIEKSFEEIIDKFVKGKFSDSFPNTNLMLKKGEHLVFDIPQISYCEERSVKMKGNHRGFSVRLMKGLSYRFGTFEGGTEQQVVELDEGNLILTNKRIIFSGKTKSVEYPLSKIVTIEPLDDGMVVNRSGKTKVEYYVNTTQLTINSEISPDKEKGEDFEVTNQVFKMTGFELRKLIQRLIQE